MYPLPGYFDPSPGDLSNDGRKEQESQHRDRPPRLGLRCSLCIPWYPSTLPYLSILVCTSWCITHLTCHTSFTPMSWWPSIFGPKAPLDQMWEGVPLSVKGWDKKCKFASWSLAMSGHNPRPCPKRPGHVGVTPSWWSPSPRQPSGPLSLLLSAIIHTI